MHLLLQECGLQPKHTVLAALSGGADSVVLLHLLCRACAEGKLKGVAAAHLHHGLRGRDADEDARFCERLCLDWQVPFYLGHADVRQEAAQRGLSLETAARELRYGFLRETCQKAGTDAIAVAHHMDDQAETVLLHLLRGSGTDGLAGMRFRRGDLVRPLLGARRSEIESYARENGLSYRTDATNTSDEMTRNRVRHELLPLLASYNPRITERLCSLAALAAQDADCLDAFAASALDELSSDGGFERRGLSELPAAIRSRALKSLLCDAQQGDVERRDVERVDQLLCARTGTRIELRASMAAWVDSRALYIGRPQTETVFSVPFCREGTTVFPGGRFVSAADGAERPRHGNEACIDRDRLPTDAVVRTRHSADRFHPLGAPGSRKLSDVMTDRKLPRFSRGIPLLCSGERVLWMPGYTIAEELRITPRTQSVLHIIFEEDQGNGTNQAHGTGHSGSPFG